MEREYRDRLKKGNNLRVSESHLISILDVIQVGIVVIDEATHKIVDVNKVATKMIGKKRKDVVGSHCWQYFCHSEKEACTVQLESQPSNGSEQELVTSSGQKIPIVKTVGSITMNGKRHLIESFLDVSELKKARDELEQANKKILEQQKALIEEERLKVHLQMAGVTAHELNQPLTALLGKIELMKMDRDNPAKLVEHIDTLEEAGCRILEIAKRIQEIRRGDAWLSGEYTGELDFGETLNILYVEDADEDFDKIGSILRGVEKINLFRARGISDATGLLERANFDLILMEHRFSDGKSLDFMELIKRRKIFVPVVVITGYGNELIASQVIQFGAYDYLPKDLVNKESLTRTIANAMEKFRLKQEIKRSHQRMAEMSIRDPLTGLYNRRYFVEALEREVARAERYRSALVLCMADIDHFKVVNDNYGHLAGDMVLSQLGRMLKEFIRESDLLCRFGGEEFAIILTHTTLEKAHMVCERFREMVAERRFGYNGLHFKVTVSIGMASYEGMSESSPWQLVEFADQALYEAKGTGRNRVVEHRGTVIGAPSTGHLKDPAGDLSRGGHQGRKKSQNSLPEKTRLGEILVQAGRITVTQRDQAIAYQHKTSCRIGDALQHLGHVTSEDVLWAVAYQRLEPTTLQ